MTNKIYVQRVSDGYIFEAKKIQNISITKETDISGNSLPYSVCQISLLTDEDITFEVDEKVIIFEKGIQKGMFWVEKFERKSNYVYQIDGHDSIGQLEKMDFYGGGIVKNYTLYKYLDKITEDSGITININSSIEDRKIDTSNLLFTNCRNALHQICLIFGFKAEATDNGDISFSLFDFGKLKKISNKTILKRSRTKNKANNYLGIELKIENSLFMPPYDEQTVFLANSEDAIGTEYFVDFGQNVQIIVVSGLEFIKQSSNAALLRKTIEAGGDIPFIRANVPNEKSTKKIKYLKSSSLQQKQIQQISNIYVFESGYQNAEKALKRLLDYSQGDVLKCTVGMGEEVKIPNKYGANKYGEFLYGKKDSEFISLGDYVETADEFGTSFTGIVQKEKYSLTTGIIVKELEIKEVKDYGSWQLD